MALSTQLPLALKLKKEYSYNFNPPLGLRGLSRVSFAFYLYLPLNGP